MRTKTALLTVCVVTIVCAPAAMPRPVVAQTVTINQSDDRLAVLIDGSLFTEYIFRGHSRPILFPIIGPHGLSMTRSFPIKMGVPGESNDHPHQKPMFFAYGWVNGVNFFAESPDCGKTEHDQLLEVKSNSDRGLIRTSNRWVAPGDKVVCTDTRAIFFQLLPGGRAIDWEITIRASHGDVTFRDDKHGIMAIRTHPNLRLDNNGQAVNSEGISGNAVFGKRANWIDYWGAIDGKTVGVAIFDHPTNPRHPTWWMARGYGYIAADPFGAHSIGAEPPGAGDMTIKAGETITFRYRFLFHQGDPKQAQIADQYRKYTLKAHHPKD